VEEDYDRNLSGNWSGTGVISGVGDAEILTLYPGDSMESETWFIGSGSVIIVNSKYGVEFGVPTIEYKTGATKLACEAAGWNNYTGAFSSLNWVKIRVSA